MKIISSRENPAYKSLKRCAESPQAAKRAGIAILEGVHLCQSYQSQRGRARQVWVNDELLSRSDIQPLLDGAPEVYAVPGSLMHGLESTEHGQGVLYVVDLPSMAAPEALDSSAIVLDRVQDPGNVGSILRTCAAVGVRHAVLSRGTASAWSTKVLRAGMGAHFSLSIYEDCDLSAWLDTCSLPVIATSSHAEASLWGAALPPAAIWLFGHEGQGVDPSLLRRASLTVNIPLAQETESLNVAAAVAVCLFEQRRRQERI